MIYLNNLKPELDYLIDLKKNKEPVTQETRKVRVQERIQKDIEENEKAVQESLAQADYIEGGIQTLNNTPGARYQDVIASEGAKKMLSEFQAEKFNGTRYAEIMKSFLLNQYSKEKWGINRKAPMENDYNILKENYDKLYEKVSEDANLIFLPYLIATENLEIKPKVPENVSDFYNKYQQLDKGSKNKKIVIALNLLSNMGLVDLQNTNRDNISLPLNAQDLFDYFPENLKSLSSNIITMAIITNIDEKEPTTLIMPSPDESTEHILESQEKYKSFKISPASATRNAIHSGTTRGDLNQATRNRENIKSRNANIKDGGDKND